MSRAAFTWIAVVTAAASFAACSSILGLDEVVPLAGEGGTTTTSTGGQIATGGSAAQGGDGGQGGEGGQGGVGTGGSGGAGGEVGFVCADLGSVPQCTDPDQAACLCVGCLNDSTCTAEGDDCVCGDCVDDSQCNTCGASDGFCNPWLEGCNCPDCLEHPACNCQTCYHRVTHYDEALPTCPEAEATWDAVLSCFCATCPTECAAFCTNGTEPDGTCATCLTQFAINSCSNALGPCEGT